MVKPQGQDYGPNRSGGSAMSMFSGPRLAPGGLAPKTSQKIPQGLNINPGDYSPPSSGSSSSSASSKPALDFSQLRGISGIGGMPNIAALQNQLNARPAASAASNPFMGLFGGLLAMGGGGKKVYLSTNGITM